MFSVNDDMSIYVTRGDIAFLRVTAYNDDGSKYIFQAGDVVRFKVTEKKACENAMFYKDFGITEEAENIVIHLTETDTKIGEVISKPTDYWYEIELNPFTNPQTIVGYDEDGAKLFKLFPEGNDVPSAPIEPEDIPIVDKELDATSERPVQNQAVTREVILVKSSLKGIEKNLVASDETEFRFGVNDKGEYGYIVKKDGADTVIPFKRAFGNATVADVLAGKTFTNNDAVEYTGTMPNNGAKTASLNCGDSYTIQKGYHNGSGKITANSLAEQTEATASQGQLMVGSTAWVNGVKLTGTMPNNSSVTESLNCGDSYTIPKGYHNGKGEITANSLESQQGYIDYKNAVVNGLANSGLGITSNTTASDLLSKLLARFPETHNVLAHLLEDGGYRQTSSGAFDGNVNETDGALLIGCTSSNEDSASVVLKGTKLYNFGTKYTLSFDVDFAFSGYSNTGSFAISVSNEDGVIDSYLKQGNSNSGNHVGSLDFECDSDWWVEISAYTDTGEDYSYTRVTINRMTAKVTS